MVLTPWPDSSTPAPRAQEAGPSASQSPGHPTPSCSHPSTFQLSPITLPHRLQDGVSTQPHLPPPPTSSTQDPDAGDLPTSAPQRLWTVGFQAQLYDYLPGESRLSPGLLQLCCICALRLSSEQSSPWGLASEPESQHPASTHLSGHVDKHLRLGAGMLVRRPMRLPLTFLVGVPASRGQGQAPVGTLRAALLPGAHTLLGSQLRR